jgi:phage tail-like protein
MADALFDPLVAAYFTIETQGKVVGAFAKLEGGGSKNKPVLYYSTNAQGKSAITQEPGPLELTPYTLKRGVTNDLLIIKWRKMVEDGKIADARVNASIIGYKQDGTEVLRINLMRCWPQETKGFQFDAQSGNVVMEECVLVYEEVERVK